jgi:mRNA interferase MazF
MDPLKRGDVVTVAGSGDFAGKPRPAVVVQSDLFNPTHASVIPITTTMIDAELFRIDIRSTRENGLKSRSQAMVDKIVSVRCDRIGTRIGVLAAADIERIDRALRTWLTL